MVVAPPLLKPTSRLRRISRSSRAEEAAWGIDTPEVGRRRHRGGDIACARI